MKMAISTDGDYVSPHFGRCPSFTIIEIEDGKLLKREVINNPGHSPGFLPQFLFERGVKYLVAGGVGRRAEGFFREKGIDSIVGVAGRVDDVIDKILKGELEGGESLCKPGRGRGYGIEKDECDHSE